VHLPELRRRVRAASEALKAVGYSIAGVDIAADGSIRVLTGEPAERASVGRRENSVDRHLRRAG